MTKRVTVEHGRENMTMKLALASLLSIFCCSAAAEWFPLSGPETDALYADLYVADKELAGCKKEAS
jgi:hypothetical protein